MISYVHAIFLPQGEEKMRSQNTLRVENGNEATITSRFGQTHGSAPTLVINRVPIYAKTLNNLHHTNRIPA